MYVPWAKATKKRPKFSVVIKHNLICILRKLRTIFRNVSHNVSNLKTDIYILYIYIYRERERQRERERDLYIFVIRTVSISLA